jgi:OmpA-OmpF porin, OOP family
MKSLAISTAVVAALGLGLAAPSFAQSPPQTTDTDTWRMPYERGFWGHAGLSFGQSKLDAGCPVGFPCDDKDQTFRLYAGGRFNNAIGLELGVLNPGRFRRGGGETDGWGADAALIAGIPIGANSSIFGKLGVIYSRMEVTASPLSGVQTGKERGFGGRWGVGAQVGLTRTWALRADFDRYLIPLPGDHEDLETLTLGVQYTFR